MDNITAYQKMLSEFGKWQKNNNTEYSDLWELVNAGKATYEDAQKYSRVVAGKWSELLKKYFGIDADIQGLTADDMARDIETALKQCYRHSSYYASKVQEIINDSVGINIKAVEGQIDKSRIENLIEKLRAGEDVTNELLITADNVWLIEDGVVENISMSAVTDTIRANAKLHTDAGLTSYIERKQGPGGCCKWCNSVAGRYVYGEQPDDFFKIHKHCNCVITYMPSRQRWQRITYSTDSSGKRHKNTRDM
jgi:hypothetical protein